MSKIICSFSKPSQSLYVEYCGSIFGLLGFALRFRGSPYEPWALSSVADPYSLDPDPNVLMTKNWGKIQTKKMYFFIRNCHFCPPGSGSRDPIEYGSNPEPQKWFI
jgi:hypothetical protein